MSDRESWARDDWTGATTPHGTPNPESGLSKKAGGEPLNQSETQAKNVIAGYTKKIINARKGGEGGGEKGPGGIGTVKKGPNHFDWIMPNNPDLAILSTMSKSGVVDFVIEATGAPVHGWQMFTEMVRHYGSKVTAINGTWVNKAKSPDNLNLGKVNELTAAGMRIEEAIYHAWTSEQAKLLGFTKVRLLKEPKGKPGAYKSVEVQITK